MADDGSRKVIMIGESGVGKSAIVFRGTNPEAELRDLKTTIGAAFAPKRLKNERGESVTLALWDTAGDERFRTITRMYFRGACAAVIVYDVTSLKTLQSVEYWLK